MDVIEGWKVQAVVEAPLGLSALSDNEDAHHVIRLTVPGEIASSLILYSMEECFLGFTVPFLKELVGDLEIKPDVMPTTEIPLLRCIFEYLMPGAGEDYYIKLLETTTKTKVKFDSVLQDEDITAACIDVIEPDLLDDMKTRAKEYAKHVEAMKTIAFPKAKAKPSATPNKKKKVVGTKILPLPH